MPPFNKPYPTFYWSAIVNVALSGSDVILPVKYDSGFLPVFYRQVVNRFSCINNVSLH